MSIIFSEGSGVANSIFGKSQEPIKTLIESGVEAFQEFSAVDKIFSMDTTKNYAEKYTSETSMGDFADVGENGAYPKPTITSRESSYSSTGHLCFCITPHPPPRAVRWRNRPRSCAHSPRASSPIPEAC